MGNLADVQQAVFAGQHVHQGTKFQDLDDRAFIDLANFHFGGDFLDAALGFVGLGRFGGGDGDGAVFLDVDLATGLVGQRTDGGTALADHVADLLGVDLHGEELGCEAGDFGLGLAHGFLHLAQNVHARFLGLGQGDLHDLFGDALDFDVHLQRGDAGGGARHLEVHVAQVIFIAQDVGQHGKLVVFLDQTHGDAGHVRLHGHARIHHRQAAAAHRSHRRRAIRFGDFRHHADGVGKFFFAGQAGHQGALGQTAVADFAALGRAHAAHFAGGKGRHVVVEQEAVFKLAGQRVDALCVALSAQGGNHQRLRFATRKQRRAVGARQHAAADFNGAHGARVAAVDARLARQNLRTHDARFDVEQHVVHLHAVKLHALLGQRGLGGGVGFAAGLRAQLLVAVLVGGAQRAFGQLGHLGDQGLVLGFRLPIPHGLTRIAHQFVDGVDGNLALLVAIDHRAQHDFFGQLFGFGFDHQHSGFGAGNDQIHLAVLAGGLAGVEHVFAIDVTHAGRANGAVKGNAGHRQRCAGGDHGGDVGIDFGVQRNGVDDHMHFVVEAFGEQRANRAVDQAAGQRFQLRRLGFALEEAARNLASGVGFFDVVHRQGEKVLPGLGGFRGHHGGQHHGVVDVHQHRTAGLAGDFAGFHGHGVLTPLEGFGHFIKHGHSHHSF